VRTHRMNGTGDLFRRIGNSSGYGKRSFSQLKRGSPFSMSCERWRHGVTSLRAFSFNPDHSHITRSPPAIPRFTSRPGTGDQLFCAANDQLFCGRSAILGREGIGYCGQGGRSGIVKGRSEIEKEECLFELRSPSGKKTHGFVF
jgi:hypothetical protein